MKRKGGRREVIFTLSALGLRDQLWRPQLTHSQRCPPEFEDGRSEVLQPIMCKPLMHHLQRHQKNKTSISLQKLIYIVYVPNTKN